MQFRVKAEFALKSSCQNVRCWEQMMTRKTFPFALLLPFSSPWRWRVGAFPVFLVFCCEQKGRQALWSDQGGWGHEIAKARSSSSSNWINDDIYENQQPVSLCWLLSIFLVVCTVHCVHYTVYTTPVLCHEQACILYVWPLIAFVLPCCLASGWCLDLGAKAEHEMPGAGAPLETCCSDGSPHKTRKSQGSQG